MSKIMYNNEEIDLKNVKNISHNEDLITFEQEIIHSENHKSKRYVQLDKDHEEFSNCKTYIKDNNIETYIKAHKELSDFDKQRVTKQKQLDDLRQQIPETNELYVMKQEIESLKQELKKLKEKK